MPVEQPLLEKFVRFWNKGITRDMTVPLKRYVTSESLASEERAIGHLMRELAESTAEMHETEKQAGSLGLDIRRAEEKSAAELSEIPVLASIYRSAHARRDAARTQLYKQGYSVKTFNPENGQSTEPAE